VLDMSGSNEEVFDAMLDFTRRLTLGLPVTGGYVRVAVVRYSDAANVSFYLNTYSTGQQVSLYIHLYSPFMVEKINKHTYSLSVMNLLQLLLRTPPAK